MGRHRGTGYREDLSIFQKEKKGSWAKEDDHFSITTGRFWRRGRGLSSHRPSERWIVFCLSKGRRTHPWAGQNKLTAVTQVGCEFCFHGASFYGVATWAKVYSLIPTVHWSISKFSQGLRAGQKINIQTFKSILLITRHTLIVQI